jgi:succinyl-CoA synthetase beta subunit
MTREQAAGVAAQVGLAGQKEETADMLLKMYDLFMKKDASLIEINPYAEDANGKCKKSSARQVKSLICFINFDLVFSLDAKMRFDDNAEFRQKEVFALRDWTQEDEKEVEAARSNLNYIALDGE